MSGPPGKEVTAPENQDRHHDNKTTSHHHMTDTSEDISAGEIIGLADTKRFLVEILTGDGLPEDEVRAAYDAFTEWYVVSAMLEMWLRREVTLRWDTAQQDLLLLGGDR
jgi:hypothetical protein